MIYLILSLTDTAQSDTEKMVAPSICSATNIMARADG